MKLVLLTLLNLMLLNPSEHPTFKGGQKNLTSFITFNLIYPEYAKQNCLQGTINVSFKVTKQGRIFESKITKGLGIDLDDEALRIIRLTSGKWIVPADHDTTVALVIPINFSLKEYHCEQKSSDDIKEAITAYKTRGDLTKAIFNFYTQKPPRREGTIEIERLKAELGYNEKFINKMIRQGQRKLKQGDKESACEDFNFVRKIGSNKADKLISENCP